MDCLEDLLLAISKLEGEERESVVAAKIHDFNNLLTTIIGFSNILHMDIKFNLSLETHDWARNVDQNARLFNSCLERLEQSYNPEELFREMDFAYNGLIICPPDDFLRNKKAVEFRKKLVAAQKVFKQHSYTTLCLGEKPEEYDFHESIKMLRRTYSHNFKERNISLVEGIAKRELVTSELYDVALDNLLGNALKYAADDCKEITVFCLEGSLDYVVAVENDGSNVLSKEDCEKIFIPGYRRGDVPAVSSGRSLGRGLDKVRTQVEDYGGQIWVVSPVKKLVEGESGHTFVKTDGVGFYFTVPKELVIS